mmetsp:Transcript_21611/g.48945  ORF Transcript_21611/g.48945 Transcript_21611/m.48945 type:complete len:147 (-) Transcript_21611:114-554(-)
MVSPIPSSPSTCTCVSVAAAHKQPVHSKAAASQRQPDSSSYLGLASFLPDYPLPPLLRFSRYYGVDMQHLGSRHERIHFGQAGLLLRTAVSSQGESSASRKHIANIGSEHSKSTMPKRSMLLCFEDRGTEAPAVSFCASTTSSFSK